jgi:uncharacterized membrane protein (DUF2068 family)
MGGGKGNKQVVGAKASRKGRAKSQSQWLLVIAVFKFLKAAALIALGIGALKLLHDDLSQQVQHWIVASQFAPGKHLIDRALEKLPMLDKRKLEEISAGTFIYAGFFLAEGVGLALRRRWGEYVTIVITGSFLPVELWEIFRHITVPRISAFIVNAAIVAYLIMDLRRTSGAQ